MKNIEIIKKIEQMYLEGVNLISYLKKIENRRENDVNDIMISYDFQAGSYVEAFMNDLKLKNVKIAQGEKIAAIIDSFSQSINTILEAGVGEATALVPTINALKRTDVKWIGGNDISWSRCHIADIFAKKQCSKKINLFVADMFKMPIADDAVDVVYTNHSMEPNGGREEELLDELYRITGKYLILVEPDYERASDEGRCRMEDNGYIKGLPGIIKRKGWNLIVNEPFGIDFNPLNPAGLLIIEKSCSTKTMSNFSPLYCPVTHSELIKKLDCFYAPEAMLAYPIVDGIPCLREDNAILASKMDIDLYR